ncbi:MAG: type II toxin-antitoxin system Phd/YefM family antitoxin [Blastococcus sp.]
MPVSDARDHLADVVNRAAYSGEAVYITRRGRRLAAIVPAEVLEAIEAAEDAADVEAVLAARAEGGAAVPWDEVKAELGLPA